MIVLGGLETVKLTLEELFIFEGSRTGDDTVAVLPTTCPFGSAQLTVALIVITAEALAAIELNETVRLLPDPPHTPPAVDEQEENVTAAGRLSVTTTEVAASGP